MQIHGLVTFLASARLRETRATALYLDLATGFLLDMFDVSTTLADNLCSQVEPGNRFKANGDFLFRPFALWTLAF